MATELEENPGTGPLPKSRPCPSGARAAQPETKAPVCDIRRRSWVLPVSFFHCRVFCFCFRLCFCSCFFPFPLPCVVFSCSKTTYRSCFFPVEGAGGEKGQRGRKETRAVGVCTRRGSHGPFGSNQSLRRRPSATTDPSAWTTVPCAAIAPPNIQAAAGRPGGRRDCGNELAICRIACLLVSSPPYMDAMPRTACLVGCDGHAMQMARERRAESGLAGGQAELSSAQLSSLPACVANGRVALSASTVRAM